MADDPMMKQKSVSVDDIMGGERPSKPKVAKTKGESSKSEPSGKKKHKHTHIEHHDNGTHTVRHTGADSEVSYAANDLDGVHDGLEQHVGEPNADEGQQPQGQPGQDPSAQPQPSVAANEPQPMPQQPQGA